MATLLALFWPAGASAVFPGSNGLITYEAPDSNGQVGIWTANSNGSGAKEVASESNATDNEPVFSPDGTRIAFVNGSGHIVVMNADGSHVTDLTPADPAGATVDEYPSWSPDASKIYFSRVDFNATNPEYDIWVMSSSDGSGQKNLTPGTGVDSRRPVVAPDGSVVAFSRGNPIEIWTMGLDGSSPKQLSNTEFDAIDPSWSPNSSKIAFSYQGTELWTIGADGNGLKQLTNTPDVWEGASTFSPDGTEIITSGQGSSSGTNNLYTVNPSSGAETEISNTTGADHPDWQANPDMLTVATGGSGSGTITSSPSGIRCPGSCSATFPPGSRVTLTPNAASGSSFGGWSGGGCSGTGACTVTMIGNQAVGAAFAAPVTGKPGPVPPGAVPIANPTSAKPRLAASLLVLNTQKHRSTLELLCQARAGTSCTLSGTLKRKGRLLGTVSGRLPGQRIGALPIRLTHAVGRLPGGKQGGTLTLNDAAPGLGRATVHVPASIVVQAMKHPPAVTTESASGISPIDYSGSGALGSAVIAGTVNPRGLATKYHFEVGPAPGAYNESLPASDASVGADGLTHLETRLVNDLGFSGFVYYYRIVAESSGGVSYGPVRSFQLPFSSQGFGSNAVLSTPTNAGPVNLIMSESCHPLNLPDVTRAQIQCIVTATDPQPAVLGPGEPVLPTTVYLDALAPTGTVVTGTTQSDQLLTMTLQPGETEPAFASFTIEHPPGGSMMFMVKQQNGPPATSLVNQITKSRVKATISCAGKNLRPGSTVDCTVSSENAGQDAADFGSFDLSGSGGLVQPETVSGSPPVVLGGFGFGTWQSQTHVRFRVSPRARPGAKFSVSLTAEVRNETDQVPSIVTATSNTLVLPKAGSGRHA